MALAIHGGAGTILKSAMTPELEAEYRGGLEAALNAGWEVLDSGGSALDAVESAVRSLEDFPLFNAGRGSVFTHEGKNEMDASIMDGSRLKAGAVAFVPVPFSIIKPTISRSPGIVPAGLLIIGGLLVPEPIAVSNDFITGVAGHNTVSFPAG